MSPAPKQAFRSSHWGDRSTTDLRYEFLKAVDKVAPELAGRMVEIVGPVFQRLADSMKEGDLPAFARIAKDQEDFLEAWEDWAQPFGLHRDRWILDHALRLLPAFLKDASIPRSFGGVPLLAAYPTPGRQITPPEPYRPDQESRPDYDKRIKDDADLREDVARTIGWKPGPSKVKAQIHLEWLARFQVKGDTVKSIADHPDIAKPGAKGKDIRSVEKILKEMAELIGLTRRTLP